MNLDTPLCIYTKRARLVALLFSLHKGFFALTRLVCKNFISVPLLPYGKSSQIGLIFLACKRRMRLFQAHFLAHLLAP